MTRHKTQRPSQPSLATPYQFCFSTLPSILTLLFLAISQAPLFAQLTGELAEMTRLEQQADDLIANGDPNGAALAIGKAAMMAGILAKQETQTNLKSAYMGTEDLFRMKENGYRAIALFEQAGGQPPAPGGACQLLSLANQHAKKANHILTNIHSTSESETIHLPQHYTSLSQEWIQIIQELQIDFSCEVTTK